jgi:predicted aspartyl protease
MGHDLTSRRQALTAGAAATLWSLAPRIGHAQTAEVNLRHDAPSRLFGRRDQPYTPPAQLSAVADLYRRMTVAIRVNGAGPFGFVVDTGANQSVISQEVADKLKLAIGPPAPLNGVAGIQMAPTTSARLEVGKHALPEQTLSILSRSGIGGDGMLGLDAIGNQALTLDFAGRNLRIESQQSNWRDPDAVWVKARRRDGQLTLVDARLGGVPLTAFVDSGAENTIGNMALRQMALARNPTAPWTMIPIISSTGQTIMAEIADLPMLKVGGLALPNWPVAFADLHTFTMWDMVKQPAILIGVDILSRFEYVCLDFARDEVRFRLPHLAA